MSSSTEEKPPSERARDLPGFLDVIERRARNLLDRLASLEAFAGDTRGLSAVLLRAVESAGDSIEVTDAQLQLIYVNPAFERTTGYRATDVIGLEPSFLRPADAADDVYRAMHACVVEAGQVWTGEYERRRKSGATYRYEATVAPVRDADGIVTHYIAVGRDVTDRYEAERQLQHYAFFDQLTDIPNRTLFFERLRHRLARMHREADRYSAVLYLDVNRLKQVNDSLGHDAGDLLLQAVAERLTRAVRQSDTVARLGGDEFCVLLDEISSPTAASIVADKVRAELSRPLELAGAMFHPSASIGVVVFDSSYASADEVVRDADIAMYRAKSERLPYAVFNRSVRAGLKERRELEIELHEAIESQRLHLHYQPIVSLHTGAVLSVEALCRWTRRDGREVSPDTFIPICEDNGDIVTVGRWVIRRACEQLVKWSGNDAPMRNLRVAINVSAREILQFDFADHLEKTLQETGVPPGRLQLEITETAHMHDSESANSVIGHLRSIGVGIHLDDFGTGFSSMSYLLRFPVDALKIDRSFVRTLGTSRTNEDVVRALLMMASALDFNVIAEGVEHAEQAAWLRASGCSMAQGFYFARPAPPEAIADVIRSLVWRSPLRDE